MHITVALLHQHNTTQYTHTHHMQSSIEWMQWRKYCQQKSQIAAAQTKQCDFVCSWYSYRETYYFFSIKMSYNLFDWKPERGSTMVYFDMSPCSAIVMAFIIVNCVLFFFYVRRVILIVVAQGYWRINEFSVDLSGLNDVNGF